MMKYVQKKGLAARRAALREHCNKKGILASKSLFKNLDDKEHIGSESVSHIVRETKTAHELAGLGLPENVLPYKLRPTAVEKSQISLRDDFSNEIHIESLSDNSSLVMSGYRIVDLRLFVNALNVFIASHNNQACCNLSINIISEKEKVRGFVCLKYFPAWNVDSNLMNVNSFMK